MAYRVIAECQDIRTGKRFAPGERFSPEPDGQQAERLVNARCIEHVADKSFDRFAATPVDMAKAVQERDGAQRARDEAEKRLAEIDAVRGELERRLAEETVRREKAEAALADLRGPASGDGGGSKLAEVDRAGLERMTRPELEALAKERGIEISDARTKADVIDLLAGKAEA